MNKEKQHNFVSQRVQALVAESMRADIDPSVIYGELQGSAQAVRDHVDSDIADEIDREIIEIQKQENAKK